MGASRSLPPSCFKLTRLHVRSSFSRPPRRSAAISPYPFSSLRAVWRSMQLNMPVHAARSSLFWL